MTSASALAARIPARMMVEKFGFHEITVEQFDLFIIDNGMADDPGTSETTSPLYRAFVQDRTTARKLINTGAAILEENKFVIMIRDPGVMYEIAQWHEGMVIETGMMAQRIRKFALNKAHSVEALGRKASKLAIEFADDDLHEAAQMIKQMSVQADALGYKVAALEHQYNEAFETVQAEVKKRIGKYDDAVLEVSHEG